MRFIDRALADPSTYTAKLLFDGDIAELAVRMAGHPDYARQTLEALSLLDDC